MILINLRIEAVDGPSIRTILSKRWESASGIDFACAETRLTTCIHRQIVGPQVVWATGPISGLPNILGSFLVYIYIYIIYIHIYNHIHVYIYWFRIPKLVVCRSCSSHLHVQHTKVDFDPNNPPISSMRCSLMSQDLGDPTL